MLWAMVQATAYRWTWPTWYRYRVALLNLFGAKIHPTVRLRRTNHFVCPWNLEIDANAASGDHAIFYALGPIRIGKRVTISQYAQLCAGTHDYRDPELMPLQRLPITIDDDAWIAADAFVGPDVHIHEGAILGARGVAFKDLAAWTIFAGNPAKPIKPRETIEQK